MQLFQQLTRQMKPVRSLEHKRVTTGSQSQLVLVLVIISLTSALGHRFYNAPKLAIGKAAPQTIYAPEAAIIEDPKATEEKRKTALKESMSVLMLDQAVNQQIYQALRRQFEQGSEYRQVAGPFPFIETSLLPLRTQLALRKTKEEDWQRIQDILAISVFNVSSARSTSPNSTKPKPNPGVQTPELQQTITDLQAYHRKAGSEELLKLLQTVNQARFNYSTALSALPQLAPSDPPPLFNASLLELTDADWQQTQVKTIQVAEQMLAQGIASGLPESLLVDAVRLQVRDWVPKVAESIAVRLLLSVLQPNLVQDDEQTRLRAELAVSAIQPEMVAVRRGQAIVQAGQGITSGQFALLDHFGLSRRGINWIGLIGFGVLVSGAVTICWAVERRFQLKLRQRDRLLICLLALTTPLLVALRVPSTNLPAIGLLVSTFYGSPLGVAVTGLLAVLLSVGISVSWSHLLSSAAGGILCGVLAGRFRSREELALLGTAVGLLQGSLYLLFNVASGTVWYTLLGSTVIHALLGLAWCIVAIGSSPYLEQLFDVVTILRLVELANPNRPLLKQLAAKAPGTFQHTLFVATLAEAAARALGCNVELVRTGTLYHDIGKMHDPLGFIENQRGGPNKHDVIDNPWKSADIIKKHVTEGLVMARKYRLPKAIQAFIPEHQGTMLIAYFYHQAQQRAQEPAETSVTPTVSEADFRYDGPIPQSRETGIVMLADSCEAALRSLKDATPDEALAMVNRILRARWQDNQLVSSGLTREEMTKIATIFVEVWQQFNHQRIAYPKLAVAPQSPVTREPVS